MHIYLMKTPLNHIIQLLSSSHTIIQYKIRSGLNLKIHGSKEGDCKTIVEEARRQIQTGYIYSTNSDSRLPTKFGVRSKDEN